MIVPSGFPSRHARELYDVAVQLGYRLERTGNHWVYTHDSQLPFSHSQTPSHSNATQRAKADLRRRHPDAPMFLRRKSLVPRAQRLSRKRRQSSKRPLSLVTNVEVEARPEIEYLDSPACVACGRAWISDLDYSSRACPECGGSVSLVRRSA